MNMNHHPTCEITLHIQSVENSPVKVDKTMDMDISDLDIHDYFFSLDDLGQEVLDDMEECLVIDRLRTEEKEDHVAIVYKAEVEHEDVEVVLTFKIEDCDEEVEPFVKNGVLSKEFFEWAPLFSKGHLPKEAVLAARNIGFSPDEVEDAYQGYYRTDEEFAQQLAEDLGLIQPNIGWPYDCISWSDAAAELMSCDYCQQDGYYFRQ